MFRLFYYDNTYNNGKQVHWFTCRDCLGLTYIARRTRGFDKYQTRRDHITRKLGGASSYGAQPGKPKGMHWRTYDRLMDKLYKADELADGAFCEALAAHFPDMREMIDAIQDRA